MQTQTKPTNHSDLKFILLTGCFLVGMAIALVATVNKLTPDRVGISNSIDGRHGSEEIASISTPTDSTYSE